MMRQCVNIYLHRLFAFSVDVDARRSHYKVSGCITSKLHFRRQGRMSIKCDFLDKLGFYSKNLQNEQPFPLSFKQEEMKSLVPEN